MQEERRLRVQELLNRQEKLKSDLAKAKDTLMLDRGTWSYDCESLFLSSCRWTLIWTAVKYLECLRAKNRQTLD